MGATAGLSSSVFCGTFDRALLDKPAVAPNFKTRSKLHKVYARFQRFALICQHVGGGWLFRPLISPQPKITIYGQRYLGGAIASQSHEWADYYISCGNNM